MKKNILFLILSLSIFTNSFAFIKTINNDLENSHTIIETSETEHSGRTNSQG